LSVASAELLLNVGKPGYSFAGLPGIGCQLSDEIFDVDLFSLNSEEPLDDVEIDPEDESEPESEAPDSDTDTRPKGRHVNDLYQTWLASPTADNTARLLEDVRQFALRIIRKKSPNNLNSEDIAQAASVKVWLNLPQLKITGKFSSWAYTVARNTLIDYVRQDIRRNETSHHEWTNYEATGGYRSVPAHEPSSDDDAGSLSAKQPLLTKDQQDATEDGLIAQIDLDLTIRKMPFRDQRFLGLIRQGYSVEELAKIFNIDIASVYNKKASLRMLMAHELEVEFPVTLHTCQPDFQNVYELGAGRYVADANNKSYRHYRGNVGAGNS
jgi:RNA polymerase sigma factor (sigma-70 family)